jgi:hypothetical protein
MNLHNQKAKITSSSTNPKAIAAPGELEIKDHRVPLNLNFTSFGSSFSDLFHQRVRNFFVTIKDDISRYANESRANRHTGFPYPLSSAFLGRAFQPWISRNQDCKKWTNRKRSIRSPCKIRMHKTNLSIGFLRNSVPWVIVLLLTNDDIWRIGEVMIAHCWKGEHVGEITSQIDWTTRRPLKD